jgi:CPA1 family monovalent cation:H+ antiporter
MFKDNNVKGRLRLLVEGESLFNDGVAAVLFGVALAWAGLAGTHAPTTLELIIMLRQTVLGGCAIGIFCGAIAILLAGRVTEHMVEAALTTVTAYGSFLLAEHFHMSGVLATVMAGLLMGNLGVLRDSDDSPVSPKGREFVLGFWEFAAFLVNSLIFPLIGVRVAQIGFAISELGSLTIAVVITLIGRGLTIYPISLLFARSRWAIPLPQQHVLFWGGLRGALALALALSLPQDLPFHGEITATTFAVVTFSIVVQGLTMPLLLRRATKS